MKILKKIKKFEGKRNSVLTMIFPSNINYKKQMEKTRRIVSQIKHANKKYQIEKVLKYIDSQNEGAEYFKPNGAIICAAYDKKDLPFYQKIDGQKIEVEEFEYYYDYVFHSNRIKELIFSQYMQRPHLEQQLELLKDVEKQILSSTNLIVLGENVGKVLEMNLCERLLFLSDQLVSNQLIENIKSHSSKLILFDLKNQQIKEFSQKFGSQIAYLRYPIDLNNLKFN